MYCNSPKDYFYNISFVDFCFVLLRFNNDADEMKPFVENWYRNKLLPAWWPRGKASASQSVNLGSIPCRVMPKDFKTWYSQLPCLTLSTEESVEIPPLW